MSAFISVNVTTMITIDSKRVLLVAFGGFVALSLLSSGRMKASDSVSYQNEAHLFDRYNQICEEDEKARLDNFGIQLNNEPEAQAYIIYYGGRCYSGCEEDYPRHRPRVPRKGEAKQRAGRIEPYLVETRGLDPARIVVIDGGFRESWEAELWIVPKGAPPPPIKPTVSPEQIVYGKGRVTKRELRAGCAKKPAPSHKKD